MARRLQSTTNTTDIHPHLRRSLPNGNNSTKISNVGVPTRLLIPRSSPVGVFYKPVPTSGIERDKSVPLMEPTGRRGEDKHNR